MRAFKLLGRVRVSPIVIPLLFAAGCEQRSPEKLHTLIAKLHSSDSKERNSAALAIAAYGEEAKEAVPELIKLLNTDKSRGIRTSAAYALRSIGTKEAVSALDHYKE